MEAQYLSALPCKLQRAINDAESLSCCSIKVIRDPNAGDFDNVELGITASGVCDATIRYKSSSVTPWTLMHETLHIRRYWNEAVPQLFARDQTPPWNQDAQLLNDFIRITH